LSDGTGSNFIKFKRIKFFCRFSAENFQLHSTSRGVWHRYFPPHLESTRNRYSINRHVPSEWIWYSQECSLKRGSEFQERTTSWRSTMRELSAEARLHLYARSLSRKTGPGIQAAALYGALALIAAVIFGSLSVHPF